MYEDGLDMSIQAERQLPQIPKIAHIGARKPLPQYKPRPDELGNYIVGAERTLPPDKSGCKHLWLPRCRSILENRRFAVETWISTY